MRLKMDHLRGEGGTATTNEYLLNCLEDVESLGNYKVRLNTLEKCAHFLAPVVDLRNYELCAVLFEHRGELTVG